MSLGKALAHELDGPVHGVRLLHTPHLCRGRLSRALGLSPSSWRPGSCMHCNALPGAHRASLACRSHKRERPLAVTPELEALVDDPTGLLLVVKDVPEAALQNTAPTLPGAACVAGLPRWPVT